MPMERAFCTEFIRRSKRRPSSTALPNFSQRAVEGRDASLIRVNAPAAPNLITRTTLAEHLAPIGRLLHDRSPIGAFFFYQLTATQRRLGNTNHPSEVGLWRSSSGGPTERGEPAKVGTLLDAGSIGRGQYRLSPARGLISDGLPGFLNLKRLPTGYQP
jgi:hypothetical protein